MHPQFVSARPSLPLGFKVGDLPPVQRPLHTDELIEVYLLDRSADSDLVLLRDREMAEHVLGWCHILGPDIAAEVPSGINTGGLSAIRLHGQWWPDTAIGTIAESQWKSLFLESLKLLKAAYGRGFYPYLKPSLIWMCREQAVLVPLYAQPQVNVSQQDLLRDLAATLISSSTGINLAELTADIHSVRSWNRYIPSDLFDALVRCVPTEDSAQISSLEELEDRIAGKSVTRVTLPPQVREGNTKRGLTNIAGMHDLKDWLRKEILGPLQNPEIYEKYRIGVPNGILFYGPPGCGKTYVARRLAEELGYFFEEIKPSDVASPYIHSTALRIRELFDVAFEKAPAVVFIDEFDAFVPSRSELGGHQQYKAEEVNEFLANLDGIATRNVLLIAATNEPEKIDPAVRRSGRFDKLVFIPPPDSQARAAMLEFYLADRPVEGELDLSGLATVLDGYSVSDLKLLVEEAAHLALERCALISTENLLDAIRRVPASITPEQLDRYTAFRARGV